MMVVAYRILVILNLVVVMLPSLSRSLLMLKRKGKKQFFGLVVLGLMAL